MAVFETQEVKEARPGSFQERLGPGKGNELGEVIGLGIDAFKLGTEISATKDLNEDLALLSSEYLTQTGSEVPPEVLENEKATVEDFSKEVGRLNQASNKTGASSLLIKAKLDAALGKALKKAPWSSTNLRAIASGNTLTGIVESQIRLEEAKAKAVMNDMLSVGISPDDPNGDARYRTVLDSRRLLQEGKSNINRWSSTYSLQSTIQLDSLVSGGIEQYGTNLDGWPADVAQAFISEIRTYQRNLPGNLRSTLAESGGNVESAMSEESLNRILTNVNITANQYIAELSGELGNKVRQTGIERESQEFINGLKEKAPSIHVAQLLDSVFRNGIPGKILGQATLNPADYASATKWLSGYQAVTTTGIYDKRKLTVAVPDDEVVEVGDQKPSTIGSNILRQAAQVAKIVGFDTDQGQSASDVLRYTVDNAVVSTKASSAVSGTPTSSTTSQLVSSFTALLDPDVQGLVSASKDKSEVYTSTRDMFDALLDYDMTPRIKGMYSKPKYKEANGVLYPLKKYAELVYVENSDMVAMIPRQGVVVPKNLEITIASSINNFNTKVGMPIFQQAIIATKQISKLTGRQPHDVSKRIKDWVDEREEWEFGTTGGISEILKSSPNWYKATQPQVFSKQEPKDTLDRTPTSPELQREVRALQEVSLPAAAALLVKSKKITIETARDLFKASGADTDELEQQLQL
jgi:hypothetical protein